MIKLEKSDSKGYIWLISKENFDSIMLNNLRFIKTNYIIRHDSQYDADYVIREDVYNWLIGKKITIYTRQQCNNGYFFNSTDLFIKFDLAKDELEFRLKFQ